MAGEGLSGSGDNDHGYRQHGQDNHIFKVKTMIYLTMAKVETIIYLRWR